MYEGSTTDRRRHGSIVAATTTDWRIHGSFCVTQNPWSYRRTYDHGLEDARIDPRYQESASEACNRSTDADQGRRGCAAPTARLSAQDDPRTQESTSIKP